MVFQINSLRHVTTDVGKCRAWIRCTLNDCVFRSYLMSIVKHRRYIIKFYNKTAIIHDQEKFGKVIALLEGIERYNFDLTLNSSFLNTWPNSTLVLAGYWTPALKNNPLYNNPQVVEAISVTIDEAIITNDNKSEESYTSSVSSSFVDTEFIQKSPPTILDEDAVWDIIMKQPSTSYATSNVAKSVSITTLIEDISNNELTAVEPSSEKEDESSFEKLTTVQDETTILFEENSTRQLPMNKDQSFNDLLESYNSRVKTTFSIPKMEDLYKHSNTSPMIIEKQYYNDAHILDVRI